MYSKSDDKNYDECKKSISVLNEQIKDLQKKIDFLIKEYNDSKKTSEIKKENFETVTIKNESLDDKFNRLINNSSLPEEFKSINLSYVNNKLVVVNEGEPLYYIVKVNDSDFNLYPNKRFKDSRALVKAKEVFDFDVQGNSEIKVTEPCGLVALFDGYGIRNKGKVSIL